MIKFFRKIHLWLSVPFGIIITLVCFSGAMLIFEPEITRAVQKDVYYVAEEKAEAIPMEMLMETVKQTLPDSVSITGVTVFSDKSRTYQVNLSKPRRASLFIDQYSSKITGRYERLGFFSTMFKLHRWLLDSANPHGEGVKVGKLLVGISTLIFVIALLTGIVIWWPRARANFRRSLSVSFKHGWKGFWDGLHVAGGMWALLIVLAMALTGLTWSFDWYRSAFYAVCGVEHTPRNMGGGMPSGTGQGTPERDRRGSGEGHPEGDRGEHRRGNSEGRPEGDRGEHRRGNSEGHPEGKGHRGNRKGAVKGKASAITEEKAISNTQIVAGSTDSLMETTPAAYGERRHGSHEGRPEGSRRGNGEGRPEGGRRYREEAQNLESAPKSEESLTAQTESKSDNIAEGVRKSPSAPTETKSMDNPPVADSVQNAPIASESKDDQTESVESGIEETPSEFADWQKIYDLLLAQNPGVPQITVSQDGASVTLGTTGNPRASDKYSFDAEKNTVAVVKAYGDSTPADKLRGWIYSIHTGSLGGIFTRIIWFLAALLGASLPLTGYYLWIRRLSHRKPNRTKATK